MKFLKSSNDIHWRNQSSQKHAITVVKNFDAILQQDSFEGLKKINKALGIKDLTHLKVTKDEICNSESLVSDEDKIALYEAIKNITYVSKSQLQTIGKSIQPISGLNIWDKTVPIKKVGLYVPGGTAPLVSSFLMQAIPAITAGCEEIVVCTPPNEFGDVHPAILWLAKQLSIEDIFKIGGAQAILAMANGYLDIPKVSKIFGPGNTYVAQAKNYVSEKVAIDMYAGPSEVMVVINNKKHLSLAASDVLSQLEHGADSCAFVLSESSSVLQGVKDEIVQQLESLKRKDQLEKAIKNIVLIETISVDNTIDMINDCAPEHLVLLDDDFPKYIDSITCAGSVFCGSKSPVAFGDYASGTNHVLPTGGWAKSKSGLSVADFMKKISFQTSDNAAFNYLAPKVIKLSEIEELDAHTQSVKLREDSSNIITRSSFLRRQTNETSIYASVEIDGEGIYAIDTGVKFLDHMLEQFAKNSLVNIFLKASGDLEIDMHHTIEDVAILLGDALSLAMGDRSKITRYASSTLIMDESRAEIDVDLCTRSNLNISIPSLNEFVGEFPTEMLNHFLDSFIKQLRFTCHIKVDGQNTHHLIEILFKCLGKCFRDALKINERMATSTKGIL